MNTTGCMSLITNTQMESKFLSRMDIAFGGIASQDIGGLDLVKSLELTKALLTLSQICVALHCPMESDGKCSNGEEEITINL